MAAADVCYRGPVLSSASPLVAVCGGPESDVDWISASVMSGGIWRVHSMYWPAHRTLSPNGPLAACILLPGEDGSGAELLRAITADLDQDVPIISVGESPGPGGRLWVHRAQADRVLRPVLESIARFPPNKNTNTGQPRWRRKSDMIIGRTPAIQDLLKTLDRLARSSAAVLVTGESGTGKELVARALHYAGPRAHQGQFVAVNCAAIPENLFEAELFGYVRGAFTGAVVDKPGLFEAADQGTLFLDEIGDMPLPVQGKLLRVLETSSVMRVGSNRTRTFNVRIVAATGRDLRAAMARGEFRSDLFFRINVYPVTLPPLRERPEDIPAIVTHHIREIAARDNASPIPIRPAALRKLLLHHWPGNVRELINVIERAMLFASPGGIDEHDIVLPADSVPTIAPYKEAKQSFDREYYGRLLRVSEGNISMAAKLASKTRKEVYAALDRLDLPRDGYAATRSSSHPGPTPRDDGP